MNAAQKACRSLDCEVSTALYNIGLGVAYSLFDNVVLQTDGILWELFGRDSREWNDVEEFFENWVIENGVTDTSYFYLGQLTGDVLQTVYVIKNLPKLISKAGNKLAGLMAGGGSYGLAMAGAGAGGTVGSIAAEVNQAIANDVVSKHSGTGQFYKGRININGTEIEYTSFGVKDGLINVGTYYPVQ
mgnify:CR=1 FL=1